MKYFLFLFVMFVSHISLFAQRGTYRGGTLCNPETPSNNSSSTHALIQGNWRDTSCDTTYVRRVFCFTDSVFTITSLYSLSDTVSSTFTKYRYYISDKLPEKFECQRLGKRASGKYIIGQLIRKNNIKEVKNGYGYYRIDSLSSNMIRLYRDGKLSPFGESITIDLLKVPNGTDNGSNSIGGMSNRGESSRSGGAGSKGSGGGAGRR